MPAWSGPVERPQALGAAEAGPGAGGERGLERSTLRGYCGVAENQIGPALGARRISKITAEDLDTFYARATATATWGCVPGAGLASLGAHQRAPRPATGARC
jgi:hypothetical protein